MSRLLPLLLLCAIGCPSIELGKAPFFCNNGTPACPEGYRCVTHGSSQVCLRNGVEITPDAASASDTDVEQDGPVVNDTSSPPPDTSNPPPKRTIVVSEFMPNPGAVADNVGEYVELFNLTNAPIDINGWTIKDNGSDSYTINAGGPLNVLPMSYLVLGASAQMAENGGVAVAHAFSNFSLGDSIDEVVVLDSAGKLVDAFNYSTQKGFLIPEGASLSLINPGVDSSDPSNWCVEKDPWSGSMGDAGSPGSGPGCL